MIYIANPIKSLQLASSLGPRFYLNIFKCKQISETGAQQVSIPFSYDCFIDSLHEFPGGEQILLKSKP